MSESRSTLKSGIIFLSVSLVINGMFSFVLFSTVQSRTKNSIGLPDFDTGWLNTSLYPQGEIFTLTHNLNTTETFVYMIGRTRHPYPPVYRNNTIHQYNIHSGYYWGVNETTIDIYIYLLSKLGMNFVL